MQKFLIYISIIIVGVVAVPASLYAQTSEITDAHRDKIIANCSYAIAGLEQVRRNDASSRVNRGQLYESISTGLMASLNSRIALNRMDGAELIRAASEYETVLEEFRTDYQVYEVALRNLIRIDCSSNPNRFYTTLLDVRELRVGVYERVEDLHDAMDTYKLAFDDFVERYEERVSE